MLHRLEASCSGIRRSPPVVADVGSAAEVWAATKAGSVAAVPDLEAEAQEVTDWAVREVEETGVEGWEAEATEVTDWVVQEVEETAGTGVEGLAGTVAGIIFHGWRIHLSCALMEGRVAFYQASITKSLEPGGGHQQQGVDKQSFVERYSSQRSARTTHGCS